MPVPRSRNQLFGTQITAREAAVLEAERKRRGERYLSAVLDSALREFLAGTDFAHHPLPVPAVRGEALLSRKYRISPETVRLVREASEGYGFEGQQIVRAAIYALERRAAGTQGLTHTGR